MDWREHPIRLPDTLSDGVLRLDAPTLADAPAHHAGEDDEMRRRFDSPRRATLEEMRGALQRWIDQRAAGGPQIAYMVRRPGAGLIGGCEIRLITPRTANIAYWIYPAHRRQGHAARAMRLLMAAAAAIDGLEVLEAHIAPDNLASRRLAERLGFVETGEADEDAWDGAITRRLVYARPVWRRPGPRGGALHRPPPPLRGPPPPAGEDK
jgi:RimJ/RimL family protein N-acetyltransferase